MSKRTFGQQKVTLGAGEYTADYLMGIIKGMSMRDLEDDDYYDDDDYCGDDDRMEGGARPDWLPVPVISGFTYHSMIRGLATGYDIYAHRYRCYLIAGDYPSTPEERDVSHYHVLDGVVVEFGLHADEGKIYPNVDRLSIHVLTDRIFTIGGVEVGRFSDNNQDAWLMRAVIVDAGTLMPLACMVVSQKPFRIYGHPVIVGLTFGTNPIITLDT